MGRPKRLISDSDITIMLALLYRPRRFSELEWALVEEFGEDLPEDSEEKYAEYWKRFVRSWRIPRKTLARRLKVLVKKGWVIRTVLPEHGHHVQYLLNFSRSEEMLKELPIPELRLTHSQMKFLKKVDAVVPLKEEMPGLNNLTGDEVLEIHLRLRAGEFVCPRCLVKGEGKKAFGVSMDADGKFYCRSCGEEVSIEECDKLLSEALGRDFTKRYIGGLKEIQRFFEAIDKQFKAKLSDTDSYEES